MSMLRGCLRCGKMFNAKSERQKYCSHSCMNTAQQLTWKKRHPKEAQEVNRKFAEKWRKENPEKLKVISDRYREKNKNKIAISQKIINLRKREQLLNSIGKKCLFCEIEFNVHFHEVNGKEHLKVFKYYLENPQDFIPLCPKHHKIVHELARLSDEKLKLILEFVKKITDQKRTATQNN